MTAPATSDIERLTARIAHDYHPERVILFGSYARGTSNAFSDVDLLVIMAFQGNPLHQAAAMLRRIRPQFAVDLLVRTPEDVRQRLAWSDYFLQDIMANGKVLYAAPDR